jgi:hypothetical protein
MMADTILLAFLVLGFIIFLLYALIKWNKLSQKKILLALSVMLIAIISIFFYTGFKKINADISRIIHNSGAKSPTEIYTLLFKKPLDSCLIVVNLKDQVIPKVDCCIWMEVKLCPAELNRIANLKKYDKSVYSKSDSLSFLQAFGDRPKWWSPQHLGDSLTKLFIKFNQEDQQYIFFGSDSSHAYICDQAL